MGMGSNLLLGSVNEDDQWVPNKVTGKQLEGRKLIDASVSGQHSVIIDSILSMVLFMPRWAEPQVRKLIIRPHLLAVVLCSALVQCCHSVLNSWILLADFESALMYLCKYFG